VTQLVSKSDLHLQDLSFLVLEKIIDGFNEAISEFLHFILHISQAILSLFTGGLEFLRLVKCSAAVGAHTHTRFLGHFA
jgi:hypothetical protein